MTGLVRKAILLTALGLAVAGAAWADVPNEGQSRTPDSLLVSGYKVEPQPNGRAMAGPTADPRGCALYIIRDNVGTPLANKDVVLDFTDCGDIKLAQDVQGAGLTVFCSPPRIVGTTNGQGELTVCIVGESNSSGVPTDLAPACDCVKVTVGGQPFANTKAATFDRDGADPGAGANDLGLIRYDFVLFPTACRSDLDFDGAVGANDLAFLRLIFVLGKSALSGLGC